MIHSREQLAQALARYNTQYPKEQLYIAKFFELIRHEDAYLRTHLPGHITGSAWIVNRERTAVLLVHHAKLNRWLQPGGHADGDEDIFAVAWREANEETGLVKLRMIGDSFFDIDIHRIPARVDFPEHDHYDIRFLFEASDKDETILSEESHELAWQKLEAVAQLTGGNESIVRMIEKLNTATSTKSS